VNSSFPIGTDGENELGYAYVTAIADMLKIQMRGNAMKY
jgi:hypothetical protein